MKQIKWLLAWPSLLAFLLLPLAAQASGDPPVLEIVNKFQHPIWITVTAAKAPNAYMDVFEEIAGPIKMDMGARQDFFSWSLGLNDSIGLFIDLSHKARKNADHDFHYRFGAQKSAGETKYVTFNPKKSSDRYKWLYPQSGSFWGLSGRTESGHSLKDNIKSEGINTLRVFTGPMPE